jgi:hypothetical protein
LTHFPLGWQHYLLGGLIVGPGAALLFVMIGRIGGPSRLWPRVSRRCPARGGAGLQADTSTYALGALVQALRARIP